MQRAAAQAWRHARTTHAELFASDIKHPADAEAILDAAEGVAPGRGGERHDHGTAHGEGIKPAGDATQLAGGRTDSEVYAGFWVEIIAGVGGHKGPAVGGFQMRMHDQVFLLWGFCGTEFPKGGHIEFPAEDAVIEAHHFAGGIAETKVWVYPGSGHDCLHLTFQTFSDMPWFLAPLYRRAGVKCGRAE